MRECSTKLQQEQQLQADDFTARNNSQVYFCRTLALVYMENALLQRYASDQAFKPECPVELRNPLKGIYMLFGLCALEKHLVLLYQGGFLTESHHIRLVKDAIVMYCSQMKPNALAFVDALAPPDWALRAPIGLKNGDPLENLYKSMVNEKSQRRVDWWEELTVPVEPGCKSHLLQSKL